MNSEARQYSHADIEQLLPWYVNDTLDNNERRVVSNHLDECEDCRGEVELLSAVQQSIRQESAIPLVTETGVDAFLDRIETEDRPRKRQWPIVAMTAAVLLVAAITIFVQTLGTLNDVTPTQFQTATSGEAPRAMDYVINVRFRDNIAEDDRRKALDGIGALRSEQVDDGMYRVILQISATSMTDLRAGTAKIEALESVKSVEIVAVQLPVE